MKIKQFEEEQLDELMLFLDENINENYERIVFLNIRKRWPDGFLTVIADGKIVGACCGAILPNEKLRVLILVLNKNYQKKGIGKNLMDKMIDASNFFDVKKVTLEVPKDSDAIRFYRRLGFSSVDVLPCYYQDGCDGIVMEKQL